ncbi:MAG: TIGR00269 family protein [Thermosphaera sp.]
MVTCSFCGRKAVYINPLNGISYCKLHFNSYLEKRVRKTIRRYNMFQSKEHIVVAVSGGKDSMGLLHVLNKLSKGNPDWALTAILVDEGISGYRDNTIANLKKYAQENNIEYKIVSFKEYIGLTLDEIVDRGRNLNLPYLPCSYCGVFRRYVLNKAARDVGGTVLATAHNLDDVVQTFLMNIISNSWEKIARLKPVAEKGSHPNFVPRVKPFFEILEKESAVYALLNGLIQPDYQQCPYARFNIRFTIRKIINDLEEKYPGTKYGMLRSLERILSIMERSQFKSGNEFKTCEVCGEPSSHPVCKACLYRYELGLMSPEEEARVKRAIDNNPYLKKFIVNSNSSL